MHKTDIYPHYSYTAECQHKQKGQQCQTKFSFYTHHTPQQVISSANIVHLQGFTEMLISEIFPDIKQIMKCRSCDIDEGGKVKWLDDA